MVHKYGAVIKLQTYKQYIQSLGVKRSTNLSALYGETGRLPMGCTRKINMLKYWIKNLKQDQNAFIKQTFLMLKNITDNRNSYSQNWASQIKMILDNYSFSYIWHYQFDIDIPFEAIKLRIIDDKQSWYTEINNSLTFLFYIQK